MSVPMKQCRHNNCRAFVPFTETYCDKHKQSVNKSYDAARKRNNPQYVSFYKTMAWRNTRKVALARDGYLCQHCLLNSVTKPAEMVDHIIPTLVDWDKRLDLNNLQSLCHSCHAKKTANDVEIYGE